jgi:hypothetical protein
VAYGKQGNFKKAVHYQEYALKLAPPQIKKKLEVHLSFYQQGQGFVY